MEGEGGGHFYSYPHFKGAKWGVTPIFLISLLPKVAQYICKLKVKNYKLCVLCKIKHNDYFRCEGGGVICPSL